MVLLAEDYGAIDNAKNYFWDLPEDNDYRNILKLLDRYFYYEASYVDSIFRVANDLKAADLQALQCAVHAINGNTVQWLEKAEQAAKDGSSLGMLLSCFTDIKLMTVSAEKLMAVSERFPLAYSLLGDVYIGRIGSEANIDRKRAAELP